MDVYHLAQLQKPGPPRICRLDPHDFDQRKASLKRPSESQDEGQAQRHRSDIPGNFSGKRRIIEDLDLVGSDNHHEEGNDSDEEVVQDDFRAGNAQGFSNRHGGREARPVSEAVSMYSSTIPVSEARLLRAFPTMPFDEIVPGTRNVLRGYMNSLYDRDCAMYGLDENTKQLVVGISSSDPMFCIGFTAYAQVQKLRPRGYLTETTESLKLRQKTIEQFRIKLSSSEHDEFLRSEAAMVLLCCLIHHELSFKSQTSIHNHWAGLVHLVQAVGGPENLTVYKEQILYFEVICAIIQCKPPIFGELSGRDVTAQYPTSGIYGSAFDNIEAWPPEYFREGLELIRDSAQLVELWEIHDPVNNRGRISSHSGKFPTVIPSFESFLTERRRIHTNFAFLRAMYSRFPSMCKCMVWASRIVEYNVTWMKYEPFFLVLLGDELCDTLAILQTKNLLQTWTKSMDILRWILFVLATNDVDFKRRPWVINSLLSLIQAKYSDQHDLSQVVEQERTNVRSFVWSNTHLDLHFNRVWRDLFPNEVVTIYNDDTVMDLSDD